MILWRPVGLQEMGLVFDSGMRRFPPRLPEQPIFYPVLARSYAADIASGWNVRDAPHAGYVLQVQLADDYASRFPVHVVGASVHRELWVPAEQLDEFNSQIVGRISAEEAFFGRAFAGEVPTQCLLAGKNAAEQIRTLVEILARSKSGFDFEVSANARAVFLSYSYWRAAGWARFGLEPDQLATCLSAIRKVWESAPQPAPLIERATAG